MSCARDVRTNKKSGSQGNERSPLQGERCALRNAAIARPIVVAVLSLASAVAIAQQRPDAGPILEQQRQPLRLPPPAG